MNKAEAKLLLKIIKKYDTIVIARHIGADPDALGSQFGLRDTLKLNFPKKEIYAVGFPASRFKFMGILDKMDDSLYKNSLLIVLDTPDRKRVDNVFVEKFEYSIKIDHHPFLEKFCDLELVHDTASSTSELICEFISYNNLKIDDTITSNLYLGIIADSNRFLYDNTSSKTFKIVNSLIDKSNIDRSNIYKNLYIRPLDEIKFQGYIFQNIKVTKNGFGYVKISDEILKKFKVDSGTPGNMVDNLNYIEEIKAWGLFTEDIKNNNIRGNIRSRGPIVNKACEEFNGGGHKFACGVKLKNFSEADMLINRLDIVCSEYEKD